MKPVLAALIVQLSVLGYWGQSATSMLARANDRLSGAPHFGIAINDVSGRNYGDALWETKSAGSDHIELVIGWDDVEVAPYTFNPDPDWAQVANTLYPSQEMAVALSFLTLDTNNDRRPVWWQSESWDNKTAIEAAMTALERTIIGLKDTELISVSLGNEIDIWLDAHPGETENYGRFVKDLRSQAKARFPEIDFTLKMTSSVLLNDNPGSIDRLLADMDVVTVTYYAVGRDFRALPPNDVADIFSALVSRFPDRPIHIAEIGYPSSEACGSSAKKQATFVENTFAAWEIHKNRIHRLNWTWHQDITPDVATGMSEEYGISSQCFTDFLGTLGLVSVDGGAKPGWDMLLRLLPGIMKAEN